MVFTLGNLFPKKAFNEPLLGLDDPRWSELEGGYKGAMYNASVALKKLEQTNSTEDTDKIYHELWNELHHQGDVGLASYYSVPHLVRIATEKKLVDSNVLSLVSLIEIQRHKNNPRLPAALSMAYNEALAELFNLASIALAKESDLEITSAALTAIAISKGQVKLANVIQNLDSNDVIDEFLENYD